jgi:chromosome segregation ATPase
LHAQLQKLKQENQEAKEFYIYAIGKSEHEIEELENELENERETRKKYHTLLKEQDIEINDLRKIIADKVQEVENLKGELQNKKEGEVFRNQAEALEKDIRLLASKQIDLNQAYTITADVLNDPDNVPLKKRKLSRSLSIDNGYDSGKESYNNHCHSPLSFVSNPVQVNSAYTGQGECSNYSSIYP